MIVNRNNIWEKEKDKHAKEKFGFMPKHSMDGPGITFRYLIKKNWEKREESFFCFVDF